MVLLNVIIAAYPRQGTMYLLIVEWRGRDCEATQERRHHGEHIGVTAVKWRQS